MNLQQAIEEAEASGSAVTVKLEGGILARFRINDYGERQVAVWADGGKACSEAEANAVASLCGFLTWDTEQQKHFRVMTEAASLEDFPEPVSPQEAQESPSKPLPAPEPPEEVRGQVCGTCGNGEEDEYGDVKCLLGWEAHDPLMIGGIKDAKGKWKNVQMTAGHPGVPLPLLTPRTRCMCRENKWKPKKQGGGRG